MPVCPVQHLKSLVLAAFVLLSSGCAGVDMQQRYASIESESPLPATYYDVDIPTHDGLHLRATIYQPELAPGEVAPLIVQTHGFGAFRTPRPMSIYGKLVISGEAAISAWKHRYWVISYDQRGFGDSDGDVSLMHPDFEVRDMSSVIDWAEANLPRLRRDDEGGTLIGTLGESYGGGVQLLASMRDPRIDALVPIATWYNLQEVLAPNDQVKDAWSGLLISMGSFGSFFDFGMALQSQYLDLLNGKMNAQVAADLQIRSPSYYCDAGQSVQADTLLLQGFRDTLFPLNQGLKNLECARRGGHDARLIALQDGHILPWPQQHWSGMPLFNTQPEIVCGNRRQATVDLIVQWYDEKLKGQMGGDPIPGLCVTYSDDDGDNVSEIVHGGTRFAINDTSVKLVQSGLFEWLLEPVDQLYDWLTPAAATQPIERQKSQGGWIRPTFVPLTTALVAENLVGVPTMDLQLNTGESDHDGIVYAAIGIRRAGQSHIEIIDEQFTPLPGDGHYQGDMPAIATRLQPGDTLGLVLQGFNGQYFLNPEGWLSFGEVQGSIDLPIVAETNHALAYQN